MAKIIGLGRGLSSLIPKKISSSIFSEGHRDILVSQDANRILQIPVEDIGVNPLQPRKVFDHEMMEELTESIKEHGIIQPLIVTVLPGGAYELIAGERRLRAAKILELASVPAIIRAAGEQEKLELALIENVQRANLNPMEKAAAYARLADEFNLTQEAVAKKMGISRSAVANTLRLLDLPEKVQQAIVSGEITEGHAKIICGLSDEKEQLALLEKILRNDFTVREVEQDVRSSSKKIITRRRLKNPLLEEKEDQLRRALDTKVNINQKGERGQIIIEFYSDEELDSIINRIVK
ncbi:ParB/RepB/Spo0J family partition protein [Candidatus Falkowbacteria bacterium]|nr:ParB/RepB/Spo0J family partition protein [Candidatus Falkowbacteria bacterium]